MYAHRSDLSRDHHFPGQVLVRVSVPPHPLTAPTLVGSSAFATVVGCRTVQAGLDEKQSVEVRISAPMVEPLIIFANGSCGTNAPEKLVFVDAPATARYGESDCGGAQVFDADLVHLDASMLRHKWDDTIGNDVESRVDAPAFTGSVKLVLKPV